MREKPKVLGLSLEAHRVVFWTIVTVIAAAILWDSGML